MAVLIKNLTRRRAPRMPFAKAVSTVLPGWEISLVFVGEKRAQSLNRTLRGKSYVPNVLSYATGNASGEIIICLAVAKRQAPAYNLLPTTYCLLLFIHALLHLKGMAHSATMERREQALVARFAGATARRARLVASPSKLARLPIPHGPQTHRYRHRHRDVPGQAGRRRRGR